MTTPYRPPFETILSARFLHRPNRFIVHGLLESGEEVRAFLPNPGRLQELLLPAVRIYLVPEPPDTKRKTRYTMVGVEGEEAPIFLHTHVNNEVARYLIEAHLVPGLEGARIVRSEVPLGRSRFDFLLEEGGESIYVEVKSCTFFGNGVAMFPDAVTARGRRHLEELATLADGGVRTVVLFVVHSSRVHCFMPDYHTDLAFTETLLAVRERVSILPMAVGWSADFTMNAAPRLLPIPWEHVICEAGARGNFVLVAHVGAGATVPAGYYVLVGWRDQNPGNILTVRGAGKGGLVGEEALIVAQSTKTVNFPVVGSVDVGKALATAMAAAGAHEEKWIAGADGGPGVWLGRYDGDPSDRREFHQILARFRMAPAL